MDADLKATVEGLVAGAQAHFFCAPGSTVVCCVLVLDTGFSIVGTSPNVAPEQFNDEAAQRWAFGNAVDELARLEAYRQATGGPRIEIQIPSAGQIDAVRNTKR